MFLYTLYLHSDVAPWTVQCTSWRVQLFYPESQCATVLGCLLMTPACHTKLALGIEHVDKHLRDSMLNSET